MGRHRFCCGYIVWERAICFSTGPVRLFKCIRQKVRFGFYPIHKPVQISLTVVTGVVSAWPGIVQGAEISASSGSQKALEFAKACLKTCDSQHLQCRFTSTRLPTRLIEVSQGNKTHVRLVETQTLPGGSYVALSYCWGKGDNLKTTTANYSKMLSSIAVAAFPQTLQDAIHITRELSQNYVWIDAICIIQDSAGDWEKESATMASVYRNAYLTIAAGTAAAATEGFLSHQHSTADYPAPFQRPWRTEEGIESILAARIVPDIETHSDEDAELLPLDDRGWCLQERLLSTRLLTFKENELYWTCLTASMCECSTRDHLASQLVRVGGDSRIPYVSLFELTAEEAFEKWKRVVADYGGRSFTDQRDRLPAIAGVATIIQALTKSVYLAGLWKDDIVLGLTWESGDIASALLSTFKCALQHYIAPTFSWASCPDIFSYEEGLKTNLFNRNLVWASSCTILDSGSVVRGSNPLGQVKGGFIQLKGHVAKAVLQNENNPSSPVTCRLNVVWGNENHFFHADARLEECMAPLLNGGMERSVRRSPYGSRTDVVRSGAPVFLLYLGKWVGTYAGRMYWKRRFLLLGRSPVQAGAFERVGTVSTGGYGKIPRHEKKLHNFEELTITLV